MEGGGGDAVAMAAEPAGVHVYKKQLDNYGGWNISTFLSHKAFISMGGYVNTLLTLCKVLVNMAE